MGGSLGQELLEETLLLRLDCGGPARALLGPDGPRLVKVGVTAHQVYRALDISEHLNLLYLRNGKEKIFLKERKVTLYFTCHCYTLHVVLS